MKFNENKVITYFWNGPLFKNDTKADRHSFVEGARYQFDQMKIELDIMDKNFIQQKEAFEYLVSMLPEEYTAGFVTHACAIAYGDEKEIEKTK